MDCEEKEYNDEFGNSNIVEKGDIVRYNPLGIPGRYHVSCKYTLINDPTKKEYIDIEDHISGMKYHRVSIHDVSIDTKNNFTTDDDPMNDGKKISNNRYFNWRV